MKYFIIIFCLCPFINNAQNFEFHIGGSVNISSPNYSDIISLYEPTIDDLLGRTIAKNYSWSLYNEWIREYYHQYRTISPKVGGTINGMGTFYLNSQWAIRTGIQLQYTIFEKTINRTTAIYNPPDKEDIELVNVEFTNDEKILYLSLPLNLSYQSKQGKWRIFGGVMAMTVLYDNDNLSYRGEQWLRYNYGNVPLNDEINEIITSVNLGLNYKITSRLGIELEFIRSIRDMVGFLNVPKLFIENTAPNEQVPRYEKIISVLRQGSIGITYKLNLFKNTTYDCFVEYF